MISSPLASKFKLVLYPCTHLIMKTSTRISRLPFPVDAIVNLSVNKAIAPTHLLSNFCRGYEKKNVWICIDQKRTKKKQKQNNSGRVDKKSKLA